MWHHGGLVVPVCAATFRVLILACWPPPVLLQEEGHPEASAGFAGDIPHDYLPFLHEKYDEAKKQAVPASHTDHSEL